MVPSIIRIFLKRAVLLKQFDLNLINLGLKVWGLMAGTIAIVLTPGASGSG